MKAIKFSKKVINIQFGIFTLLIISMNNILGENSMNKNRREVFKKVNKKKEALGKICLFQT
ncbi:MAG: hypothetical protein ACOX19_09265 [Fermentimonas sp.]